MTSLRDTDFLFMFVYYTWNLISSYPSVFTTDFKLYLYTCIVTVLDIVC